MNISYSHWIFTLSLKFILTELIIISSFDFKVIKQTDRNCFSLCCYHQNSDRPDLSQIYNESNELEHSTFSYTYLMKISWSILIWTWIQSLFTGTDVRRNSAPQLTKVRTYTWNSLMNKSIQPYSIFRSPLPRILHVIFLHFCSHYEQTEHKMFFLY